MSQTPFITNYPKTSIVEIKSPNYGQIDCSIEVPNYCAFENLPSNFSDIHHGTIEEFVDNYSQSTYHFPILYECNSCHAFFVLDYFFNSLDSSVTTNIAPYDYDFGHYEYNFDELIADVSPRFKSIYLQTEMAEQKDLSEIDEFGYRKALEFLVKDYLIKYTHETDENIGDLPLGACIKKLDSKDLEITATIASWIGNDGTHYVQKNPELTISDEKNYLEAVVAFITYKVRAQKARDYKKSHS
ncbi:DUF4145 domain-containing protein [Lactobacillus sp. LC28-10]|uniref:DUF4145 domain-containing protein n=1 Tax=Secundilactobacillus angelensis TaxID=2722706 RepID=A0ABX1KZI3_9LACO|nr:DUF4145 domain-containing protein [Secundilactobacillus angelensis]MCH5461323.1 hypothetical protein [Secundilactobacillus angelensis]NLR17481.1 DUF4145 domain-containing protein [Secundilactobacillus angelensis]